MVIRPRQLPPGWYPRTEKQAVDKIADLLASLPQVKPGRQAVAGVAPHAGWEFSGAVALDVLRHFKKDHETIVVIGGHLGKSHGSYAAFEAAYETPLGPLPADLALLAALQKRLSIQEDLVTDNSVEIQLPFIKYLYPDTKVLWMRTGAQSGALALGAAIRQAALELKKEVLVLGSTDLTHYGNAYGFCPQGDGLNAVRWVKEVNDKRLIDALLAFKAEDVISLALSEKSACSGGAAAAAIRFANASASIPEVAGKRTSYLLNYLTSWDISPGPAFVGYAGVIYV